MSARSDSSFVAGLFSGAASAALGGLALLYVINRSDVLTGAMAVQPYAAPAWFAWVDHNLGLSLPVFVVILVLYLHTLAELRRRVACHDSADRIAQMDHMTDIWTSLFFGVGVIWTAIGMRNALLHALGDPGATLEAGALALLERMVDGGILVALSTTIVGGVGGYLLRVIKTIVTGAELKRSYTRHGHAASDAIRERLDTMNRHLEQINGARGA